MAQVARRCMNYSHMACNHPLTLGLPTHAQSPVVRACVRHSVMQLVSIAVNHTGGTSVTCMALGFTALILHRKAIATSVSLRATRSVGWMEACGALLCWR